MIPVSDEYLRLTKSNIRPKCEPIITVSGIDANGNETQLVWKANNIQSLSYKRGIDPIGRELPFMELTWTEIYQGHLNEEQYPEKYNNIAQYMAVDLEWVQDMQWTYSGWGTIKRMFNWHTLASKSWQDIKTLGKNAITSSSKETIKMPRMFLVARPIIEGNTIKWTAKDLLYFFQTSQTRGINVNNSLAENPSYLNIMGLMMLGERPAYLNSPKILNAIQATVSNMLQNSTDCTIDDIMIIDSTTKDFLLNFSKLKSFYMNFENDIIVLQKDFSQTELGISLNVMYGNPKIENGTNISRYTFYDHSWRTGNDETKIIYPSKYNLLGIDFLRWDFDGYGVVDDYFLDFVEADINHAVGSFDSYPEGIADFPLSVNSLKENKFQNWILNAVVGEEFSEDNPLWIYSSKQDESKARFEFLKKYFSKENSNLEITALPNLAIEPNDIISVETHLYEQGKPLAKSGVVTEISLEYNGALRETFKVHEVKV